MTMGRDRESVIIILLGGQIINKCVSDFLAAVFIVPTWV